MFAQGINDKQANTLFFAFLVIHIGMWTLLPGLTRHELDSDSMMHFAWGQEWMLSYNLHPPLLPWVVAGFLKAFGVTNWNYFLLSQINIAIAFVAVFFLAREFLRPVQALAAVCLLEFIPYYSFLGIRLNHSSLLISIWALTTLFAFYALTRKRLIYWLVLGFCLALAMLTKYYAVTLVTAIGLYLLFTRTGREHLTTIGPYAAGFVLAALFYLHVDYVIGQKISTINHVGEYFFLDSLSIRWKPISFFLAQITYLLPAVVIFMIATHTSFVPYRLRAIFRVPRLPDHSGLVYLVLLFPLLATTIPGLILGVDISSRWGGPILITAGIVLVLQFPINLTAVQCGRIVVWSIGYTVLVPLTMLAVISQGGVESRYSFPGKELSATVTELWHNTYGTELKLVGGGWMAPDSIAFHSSDHPSALQHLSHQWSPWVSEEDVRKHGIAIVCLDDDKLCIRNAHTMFPGLAFRDLKISGRSHAFASSRSQTFRYFFVPPGTTEIHTEGVVHKPRR